MKYFRKNNDVVQAEEKPNGTGWKEITEEEYNRVTGILTQITELKWQLSTTDYRCLKHADGEYTDEEYEPFKQQRHNLRIQIRNLESEL